MAETRTLFEGYHLDPSGIEIEEMPDGTSRCWVHLCKPCLDALRRAKMPKFALANDLDFGTPSSYLPEPSIAEQCLFATVRARCFILKLTSHQVGPPETTQRAIKGHVICFPQPVQRIFNSLPHEAIDLLDVIQIIYLGSDSSREAVRAKLKRCKLLTVRRRVVHQWLKFLRDHNRFYTNVEINERCVSVLIFFFLGV